MNALAHDRSISLNWAEKSSERKTEGDVSDNSADFLHRNEVLLSFCHPSFSEIITARKRSLRRLCFYTDLSVIIFTGRVSAPVHAGIPSSGPEADIPPEQTRSESRTPKQPPPSRLPLHSACWATSNKRAVRILLKCILVSN